jgi:2-polyprenyl-3-methyl-5-hydroxy-6-metoxy-1,4-benzoquinol methylase
MSGGGRSADERVVDLYERTAAEFDRARTKSLFETPWLDRFAALLPDGGSVLDVGCGSGEPIARYLIESGFSVRGVDSSPSLISMCRERFPDQEWLVGDMRELDLGRRFDGIIAWHSLFHLTPDDQRSTLIRLTEHLDGNGALMFTSGPEAGEIVGEWQREPLYSASLDPNEYEQLLQANGLHLVERRFNDEECGGASVWLAQMRPASGLDGSA